jgi:septal ring factor EnvC (AmiA/AmiB activator)
LEKVDGFVGQDILAGEPIGTLLDENPQLGSGSSGRSQLYMELRYKGEPIDPTPWLKS